MDDVSVGLIVEIVGLILGGGGLIGFAVGFATFKWQRMKARGEARQAELEATKVEQDTYQEIITDLKEHNDELRKYNDEQRKYNAQLEEERKQLVIERNEWRKQQDQYDEKIRFLDHQTARLGKRLDAVTPLICTLTGCKQRVKNYIGLVSDDSFDAVETPNLVEEAKKARKKKKEEQS